MAHCIAEAVLRVVRVSRWGGRKLRELGDGMMKLGRKSRKNRRPILL